MHKYDVVILAAGIGSRLAPMTDSQPKCLTDLNGKSLITRVIEQFLSHNQVEHIYVVVGYLGEQIVEVLSQYDSRVSTVSNEIFRTTNNLYSFTLAASSLKNENDLILLNGDCAYDDEIIEKVVTSSTSSSEVCADSSTYMEESMKISVDESGRINHIAKTIKESEAFATSIDLYRLVSADKNLLLNHAENIFERSGLNSWTEVALAESFADNSIHALPLDIAGFRWYEIDNLADLEAAQKLFS